MLGVGALLSLLFRCDPTSRLAWDGRDLIRSDDSHFDIGGDTARVLAPGVVVHLDLAMTNPHDQAMTVTDLVVAVDGVTAPLADRHHPCSVDDYMVEQMGADVRATVPRGAQRSLSDLGIDPQEWPRVGMVDRSVNQDGCKGAVVTLSYSAAGAVHQR